MYSSTPLLLLLHPEADPSSQSLPLKVYEPTIEIRDRRSRTAFVEIPFRIETSEAERIAVDWSAKGSEGGTNCMSFTNLSPSSQINLLDSDFSPQCSTFSGSDAS